MGQAVTIPTDLQAHVSQAKLTDLLDFSRKDFNKAFSLTVKKASVVESRWELVVLSNYSELITKGTTPTTLGFQFQDAGINFVKIESILADGSVDKGKFAFINQECHQKLSRSNLQENDVLFSIAGALGRTTIISKELLPANTNQALAIIRLKTERT
ncbi:MAG: hypothetical protein IPI79_02910 [Moraxellaceae bacterium]|nr:hypothetical protein [Moraxellaceae bacterium]